MKITLSRMEVGSPTKVLRVNTRCGGGFLVDSCTRFPSSSFKDHKSTKISSQHVKEARVKVFEFGRVMDPE